MPTTSRPSAPPTRATARMAAFIPGASPPEVSTPTRSPERRRSTMRPPPRSNHIRQENETSGLALERFEQTNAVADEGSNDAADRGVAPLGFGLEVTQILVRDADGDARAFRVL